MLSTLLPLQADGVPTYSFSMLRKTRGYEVIKNAVVKKWFRAAHGGQEAKKLNTDGAALGAAKRECSQILIKEGRLVGAGMSTITFIVGR